MISNRTSRVFHANERGFTLVEAIFTLLLLGLLTAGAATYYFDNEREAEERFAKATVDEAQVRINTRFTSAITQGKPCDVAVNSVDTLAELADDAKTKRFGSFTLSAAKEPISESGTAVTATGVESKRVYTNAGSLKVPSCTQLALNIGIDGGLEGDGGFDVKPGQIVDEDGGCNPDLFPCGISENLYKIANDRTFISFLQKILAILQPGDSIDSNNPTFFVPVTINNIIRKYQDTYHNNDLDNRMWSLELTPNGDYRVIVSNLSEAEIEALPLGTRIECEMYDANGGVRYGTAKTKLKDTYGIKKFTAMDTSTFEPL